MPAAFTSIERVETLDVATFEARYLRPGMPVLLSGEAARWAATERWTPEMFRSKYGDTPVEVEVQHSRDPRSHWREKSMMQTTLARYVDLIDSTDPKYYLNFAALLDALPGLRADLGSLDRYQLHARPYPEVVRRRLKLAPVFWFGPKGTFTTLHRDPSDNLLAQILGRKRVVLFSPAESENVYSPWHSDCSRDRCLGGYSPVDVDAPDLARFPRFATARGIEAILAPGDVLFIPAHWWHYVVSLDTSISVSYFWFHRLSNWRGSTAAWAPISSAVKCYLATSFRALRDRIAPTS